MRVEQLVGPLAHAAGMGAAAATAQAAAQLAGADLATATVTNRYLQPSWWCILGFCKIYDRNLLYKGPMPTRI